MLKTRILIRASGRWFVLQGRAILEEQMRRQNDARRNRLWAKVDSCEIDADIFDVVNPANKRGE